MKRSPLLLLLIFLSCFCGCADSKERDNDDDDGGNEDGTDTDADSDTDTGDAGGDADSDTDTDECECFDATHSCCQEDGCTLEPEGTLCNDEYETEYSCQSEDPECGSTIFARYKQRFCDGESFICFGEISDWGEWEPVDVCETFERCYEGEDEGGSLEVTCEPDVEHCPVDFDQRICFHGATMDDCPETGCESPAPSMTLTQTFSTVGDGEPGEVVLLELVSPRRDEIYDYDAFMYVMGEPFSDIHATVKHDGDEYSFYNNYASNYSYDYYTGSDGWEFQNDWYLPYFWGDTMDGTWELSFDDSAYSGNAGEPIPFELTEWCMTFLDPEETAIDTSEEKAWTVQYADPYWYSPDYYTPGVIYQGTNYFEGQLTDLYRFDGDVPTLKMLIYHKDPTKMAIDYVTPDGQTISIKAMGTASIPEAVKLPELAGKWATGRYQLRIQSEDANSPYGYYEDINYVKNITLSVEIEADGGVDAGEDAG